MIVDLIVIDDETRQTFRPRMVSFTEAYERCITHIFIEPPDARERPHPQKE